MRKSDAIRDKDFLSIFYEKSKRVRANVPNPFYLLHTTLTKFSDPGIKFHFLHQQGLV